MWVTKLLISPVKKRIFLPKNDQIWPKIGIFGQFRPGHAGLFVALLVSRLVVVARGLYLARHLFTLSIYIFNVDNDYKEMIEKRDRDCTRHRVVIYFCEQKTVLTQQCVGPGQFNTIVIRKMRSVLCLCHLAAAGWKRREEGTSTSEV